MQNRKLILSAFGLLILVNVVLATSAVTGGVKTDKLTALIDSIRKRSKPTVESVVEAFRQYVQLHHKQSELSQLLSPDTSIDQLKGSTDSERKYKEVGEMLNLPELKIISRNLFSVVSDDMSANFDHLTVNAAMRARVEKAIDALGL